jgi:hypothetical protein
MPTSVLRHLDPERIAAVLALAFATILIVAIPSATGALRFAGATAASSTTPGSSAAGSGRPTTTAGAREAAAVRTIIAMDDELLQIDAAIGLTLTSAASDSGRIAQLMRQANVALGVIRPAAEQLTAQASTASLGIEVTAAYAAVEDSVEGTLRWSLSDRAAYARGAAEFRERVAALATVRQLLLEMGRPA